MSKISEQDIYIQKGDTIPLPINIDDDTFTFNTGDIVYFTIRPTWTSDTVTLQKTVTSFDNEGKTAYFELSMEETEAFTNREYVYDFKHVTSEGKGKRILKGHIIVDIREATR
jgi:hypothetical protein